MEKKYILALDQGTTSSRAIIFDKEGCVAATAQKEFKQIFPQPGWVEHDALEIWQTQLEAARQSLVKAKISAEEIAGIGIANQRETTVIWERRTGKPIHNAIVWQDRRTADVCNQLKQNGTDKILREKTGLMVDAYFSATKIKWLLDKIPQAGEKSRKGELCFGTIDTWILWNLTKGKIFATDVSNASRTMLFNIHTLSWDDELLKIFHVPRLLLPEIGSSSEVYGETAKGIFEYQIPIAGIAGDQQAALFGQMCVTEGMVKNTYGTGCFMLMNTGNKPILSKSGLLTTVAWRLSGETTYALEGSVFTAGAVVQWLRDGLKIIKESSEVEMLSQMVEDSGGVFVVPAFSGLGTPHWNQEARGMIVGLTRGSTNAHLARAALDSIALQTMDVLKVMEADSQISVKELRVDGGAAINNQLMQFQSDIMETKVIRPIVTETTALGAAYLAGLAVNFWSKIEEIQTQWRMEREFLPMMESEKRVKLANDWQRAVNTAKAWADF